MSLGIRQAPPMNTPQQVYDPSVSLQSIESLIAPLNYIDKPRVARDVLGLIRNSNSLAFKIGNLVHPNGSSENLLQLLGTTPIYYKGSCYNIPVNIWVVEQYPHRPPTCYVTPTKDMRIKGGHQHVDHFGLIYLPYLNQWNAQNSNLLEMVTMMSSVFSTDPPVFKVPNNATPQQQQQQQQQPPQQNQQPQGQYAQSPYGAQSANPYGPPQNQQPQYPGAHSSPSPSLSSPAPAHHQQPPFHAQSQSQPQDPRATRKNQLLATLTTKLRQQLQDDLSLKTLLMDDLLQQQSDVDAHGRSIKERLATLNQEAEALEMANANMQAKNEELTKWLEQYEKREMIEVDKLAYPKDTWSKQLLENVSLDSALEDAYYLLDRALADDRIDLPTYTKQMRNLSRKQFYARALVAQITTAQAQSQH